MMRSFKAANCRGFTLVEVLIAIAIFAILSVMAYGGLDTVIKNREHTEQELDRLKQLQMTMVKLQRDIEQTIARDGTDELGGVLYKMASSPDTSIVIELTRNGWSNFAKLKRSHLQRVAYKFEDNNLVRMSWPFVDRAQDSQALETILIDNLDEVSVRFFDNNEWIDDWPRPETLASSSTEVGLPAAVEVTLKMHDWGDIIRIFKVPPVK